MKLFLSSDEFGDEPEKLTKLVGKKSKAAVIANASDYHSKKGRALRLQNEIQGLRSLGFSVEEIDLRDENEQSLRQRLSTIDLIWVRGGNTFLLNELMHLSGFNKVAAPLIRSSELVYGGYSAGAIVAGRNLQGINIMDNPDKANEIFWDCLGFVDYTIIPHYKSKQWTGVSLKAENKLQEKGVPYRTIRDGDVIIVQ